MTSEQMPWPAATAPFVTEQVAHCQVCGVQWQVRSDSGADTKGCSFCDAPASAITIVSEAATYGGEIVR